MAGPSIRIKQAGESSKSTNTSGDDSSHRLVTFLQSQSQNTLTRLYQKPSSCLSIFRLLTLSVLRYASSDVALSDCFGL